IDDVATLVVRIGIGLRIHRVVMVFRIGRVDGDQRYVTPVLASLQRRGLCLLGLAQRCRRKRLRNFVGVYRDQADGFFARQRAEPFLDLAGGKSVAARAHQIDADEIAILGAAGVGLRDVQFAAGLFLL